MRPRDAVAITFDDGWQSVYDRALPLLDDHGFRSTQYVNPSSLETPDFMTAAEVRQMHDAGHEIGTHTQDHAQLSRLSREAAMRQITMGRDAVDSVLPGHPTPLWRAPYGSLTPAIVRDASIAGLTHVSWTLDLRDYRPRPTLAQEILDRLAPNDIVLLHDIQPGTVRQLPGLLRSIADRGYQMVTVSELSIPADCTHQQPPPPPEPPQPQVLEMDPGQMFP